MDVRTTGRMLSPIRMQFDYEIVRVEDGVVAAAGHTVHAALDSTGRPCRLPERVAGVFA
jgi:acyl-CoA thioesterase FadM